MDVINPATEKQVTSYEQHTSEEVEEKLQQASSSFTEWRSRSIREREQLLSNVADVLRDNKSTYAEQMTTETGKPITQARAEVEKCAWVCEHYAEHASSYLDSTTHPSPPEQLPGLSMLHLVLFLR